MSELRFGIVGAGMIARVIAEAIQQAEGANLVAVASRRKASAQQFANEYDVPLVFDTWEQLVAANDVDAIYIATPTSVRETIAITAAEHKKHILADKPFASYASVQRIIAATKANDVAFMDATHFVHNPRTAHIQAATTNELGAVQVVKTSFFFPLADMDNIRFNPELEPSGAIGDLAWYSMRAITEFLDSTADIASIGGDVVRHPGSQAIIRGNGFVQFTDQKSSTFDFGYTVGSCLMDLDILGNKGAIRLDDFVLDWQKGFAFDHSDHSTGYTHRTAMQYPKEFTYVATNNDLPQSVYLVQNFVQLTQQLNSDTAIKHQQKTLRTQQLVDAFWQSIQK